MKICLASSGGGHLNQIKQLENIYSKHDYYFITHKTIFSKELAKQNKVYFVNDISFGLLKRNIFYWILLIFSLFKSSVIFLKENPDVVITTGAGPALWTCYLGKLFKKKIVFIETIAHAYTPSLFGKLVYPIADLVIVQWESLLNYYRKAEYGGFIFAFSEAKKNYENKNKNKIFITVGTHDSFDRLIIETERLFKLGIIKSEIIAQIGDSNFFSKHIKTIKKCSPQEIDKYMIESVIVITHGGSGSIINAILKGCIVIAVPRRAKLREHYDNHQFEIVKAFEDLGLILSVYEIKHLGEVYKKSSTFKPKFMKYDSKIDTLILNFLEDYNLA